MASISCECHAAINDLYDPVTWPCENSQASLQSSCSIGSILAASQPGTDSSFECGSSFIQGMCLPPGCGDDDARAIATTASVTQFAVGTGAPTIKYYTLSGSSDTTVLIVVFLMLFVGLAAVGSMAVMWYKAHKAYKASLDRERAPLTADTEGGAGGEGAGAGAGAGASGDDGDGRTIEVSADVISSNTFSVVPAGNLSTYTHNDGDSERKVQHVERSRYEVLIDKIQVFRYRVVITELTKNEFACSSMKSFKVWLKTFDGRRLKDPIKLKKSIWTFGSVPGADKVLGVLLPAMGITSAAVGHVLEAIVLAIAGLLFLVRVYKHRGEIVDFAKDFAKNLRQLASPTAETSGLSATQKKKQAAGADIAVITGRKLRFFRRVDAAGTSDETLGETTDFREVYIQSNISTNIIKQGTLASTRILTLGGVFVIAAILAVIIVSKTGCTAFSGKFSYTGNSFL